MNRAQRNKELREQGKSPREADRISREEKRAERIQLGAGPSTVTDSAAGEYAGTSNTGGEKVMIDGGNGGGLVTRSPGAVRRADRQHDRQGRVDDRNALNARQDELVGMGYSEQLAKRMSRTEQMIDTPLVNGGATMDGDQVANPFRDQLGQKFSRVERNQQLRKLGYGWNEADRISLAELRAGRMLVGTNDLQVNPQPHPATDDNPEDQTGGGQDQGGDSQGEDPAATAGQPRWGGGAETPSSSGSGTATNTVSAAQDPAITGIYRARTDLDPWLAHQIQMQQWQTLGRSFSNDLANAQHDQGPRHMGPNPNAAVKGAPAQQPRLGSLAPALNGGRGFGGQPRTLAMSKLAPGGVAAKPLAVAGASQSPFMQLKRGAGRWA